MKSEQEVAKAIFDIKPVDPAGRVDLGRFSNITSEINLRKSRVLEVKKESKEEVPEELIPNLVFGVPLPKLRLPLARRDKSQMRQSSTLGSISASGRENLIQELEEELKKENDVEAVLASVGGEVAEREKFKEKSLNLRLRRQIISKPREKFEFTDTVAGVSEPQQEQIFLTPHVRKIPDVLKSPIARTTASPAGREIELWLEKVKEEKSQIQQELAKKSRKKFLLFAFLVVALLVGGFFIKQSGLGLKRNITDKGSQAVRNLEEAKTDVEKFDFASAANHFNLAYDNFSEASSRLNLLGNSLTSFLGSVPGLDKLKSAQNLIKAGENIAKAGKTVSSAINNFYQTNPISGFGLNGGQKKSLSEFIGPFRDSLISAQDEIKTAGQLLASVDEAVIPEEKKKAFLDFQSQLPLLEKFAGDSVNYANFLSEAVGESGPKKYLLLFENNTELRPTGGFPGTYALADFSRGFLRELKVDDIYNIDGQAKKNIIPPSQIQHITPNWGARDANWFANFPDSAKKVMQFYTENDGGPAVDGVITLTPTVISRILDIVGPIELPNYDRTIDSVNFLSQIQEEVEYGDNRERPKQVLVDFAPKFLEKLSQQSKEKWLAIFKIFAEGIEQKQILAYFKNPALEKVVLENNFAGEVKKTDGDYLMIVHSNVKGSKTDAVIDNSYNLSSNVSDDGTIEHTLRISRTHNGGQSKFGFYNRTNPDYIRVLVPEMSKLLAIKGNSSVDFKPLVNYKSAKGYEEDVDLKKYESGSEEVFPGVKKFSEAGKTAFGFWLKLEPGQKKEVVLRYQTPVGLNKKDYTLLVQKQAGTIDDEFSFNLELPAGEAIIYKYPDLSVTGGLVEFQGSLTKDLMLGLKLR